MYEWLSKSESNIISVRPDGQSIAQVIMWVSKLYALNDFYLNEKYEKRGVEEFVLRLRR